MITLQRIIMHVAIVAPLASFGWAAPEAPMTTREYDVRELVAAGPEASDEEKATTIKTFADWVVSLGRGGESPINVVPGAEKFSIRATSDQHDRITRLVDALRERTKIQITVETRLIRLSEQAEAKVDARLAETLVLARSLGNGAFGVALDDATLAGLIEAAQNGPNSHLVGAPRITLFNGQRAYVMVRTQRELTTGYTRNADDPTKWDPKVEAFQTGLLLDVQARAADPDSNVALAVKAEDSRVLGVEEKPFKDAPELTVQVPTLDVRKLDALVSTPANQTMLFCIPPGENTPKDDPRLYVLVRAMINEN